MRERKQEDKEGKTQIKNQKLYNHIYISYLQEIPLNVFLKSPKALILRANLKAICKISGLQKMKLKVSQKREKMMQKSYKQ